LKTTYKEAVMAYFEELLQHLPEQLGTTYPLADI
jgi:hypothetical protein